MPVGVNPSTGDGAAWVIPGAGAVIAAAGGALWVAGGIASMVSGRGWRSAPFTLAALVEVIKRGPGTYWPGTSPHLVLGLAVVLFLPTLVLLALLVFRLIARGATRADLTRSLARLRDMGAFLRPASAARAQRLRPTLTGRKLSDLGPGDVGIRLGQLRGRDLFSSWEDVAVAFMAPRSGKTTSLAVPIALAAPGAVVLTSNKVEGWKETAALRAQDTGQRVWTFDPQRVAHVCQDWWWNPLRGLTTVEEAERFASHFVATVEDEAKRDLWGPAAMELLASLLLAASCSGGTLLDVYEWLALEASPVPGGILREHGYELLARTLRGTQDSAPETRASIYLTARAAAKCLRNGEITAWVTPPAPDADLVEFTVQDFPNTRQTLYLLSKDGGGSAGPLVAALTDRVLRAGVAAAERRGGRLDPPMVLVLDEAANICRIADLPALYSHLGSRGIIPWTILQSYSQAVGVWGETGSKALWGAATIKLVGAGMDDANFAEDISRLIGDHDVLTVSRSSGGGRGSASRTHSTRSQRILSAAAVRQLPKGSALLLATGTKPALIRLQPWYAGPRRAEITAAAAVAESQVTAAARNYARPCA